MPSFRISDVARLLAVSDDTVRRWIGLGRLRTLGGEVPTRIDGADVAALALELGAESGPSHAGVLTPTSARNRLSGIVTGVKKDTVMAQIDVQAGPFRVVSLISAEAADELGLVVGSEVVAVVKATNVMVERPVT